MPNPQRLTSYRRRVKALTMPRTLRFISFATALAISISVMLFPFLLRHVQPTSLHSALPVLMLGVAGAMVYGIGYTPDRKFLRILFSPVCSWALILAGAWWLVQG